MTGPGGQAELNQLGPNEELGTDSAIILVGAAGLRVGPREPAADGGIVRLRMDRADIVLEEHATPAAHTRAPFAPARPVYDRCAMGARDSGGLVVTQGDAVGAAGRQMGTGIARQRRMFVHAAT